VVTADKANFRSEGDSMSKSDAVLKSSAVSQRHCLLFASSPSRLVVAAATVTLVVQLANAVLSSSR
jgi:hypothetical protein